MAEEQKGTQPTAPVANTEVDFDVLKDKANETFQKYKGIITILLAVIVLGGGGYYVYRTWIKAPKEAAANDAIFRAQRYFEIDSFQVALDGKGDEFSGFLSIIEDYGSTSAGNLAHYYAGACYLYLGNYDQALTFLGGYSGGDDHTQAVAYGMMGDAYYEQGNLDEALNYYEKAAKTSDTEAVSPFFLRKAGLVCEQKEDKERAKAYYERIEKDYPQSADALGIKKDLIRVTGAY